MKAIDSEISLVYGKDFPFLQISEFNGIKGFFHMFTTRKGGSRIEPYHSFNLGFDSGDSVDSVLLNRKLLSQCLGGNKQRVFFPKQVHGNRIVILTAQSYRFNQEARADGVITQDRSYAISILTADCLPIILVDPATQSCGVIHAGWRSSLAGITRKAIAMLKYKIGVNPHSLLVGFGPSIRACCYEVGKEIAQLVKQKFPHDDKSVHQKEGSDCLFMDLAGFNKLCLINSDVPEENIFDCGFCTSCHNDLFFSHRAQHGMAGRQATLCHWG